MGTRNALDLATIICTITCNNNQQLNNQRVYYEHLNFASQ